MTIFNNINSKAFSNFSPQHPAAHGLLFSENSVKKHFIANNSSSLVTTNFDKLNFGRGISETHINEFLEIINSLNKNKRQSRLINSYEIIDYFNVSRRGYNNLPIKFGLWFQNSKTQIWSILELEEITGNFQNPQNGVFLGLMTFQIIDIADLPSYDFLYNGKTYQMDGTLSSDSMNEIINKIDSNLIIKFLENVLISDSITDFDKFITIVILSNHRIVSLDENPSRLCGIVLPALFSNKAKYHIYSVPTIYIRPYSCVNDLKNCENSGYFYQIPAPVSEKTRVPYYDDCPGDETDLDGSIPFEALDIKFWQNLEFKQDFDFMKLLAERLKITHTNLDWVIFMLINESKLGFGTFAKIQNLKELSSKDISNSIGYHLPIYYCLTDYDKFLKESELRYLENVKKRKEMLLRIKTRKDSNKNFNLSNFSPQHPAVHGIFRNNKLIKNIIINKFFSISSKSENDQRLRIQEWQNWINNLNSNEIRNIFLENNKIRNFRKQPFEFALFKTLENNVIIPYFLIIPFSDIVSNLVIRINGNKSYLFNFIKLHNGELVPLIIPFSRSNTEVTHFESLFWDNSIGNAELTSAKIFAPEFYNYFINELKKIINNNRKKQHLCVCDFYYQTLIKYNEKLYSEFTPLTFIFGELVSLSLFKIISKFFKMDLSVTKINYGTLNYNACYLSPIPYLAWLAPSPSIRKIILKILIKIGKNLW